MALILGIETSCDETAAAVYDTVSKKVVSNSLFSQVALHEKYGGVVPEIASRSHLEKIGVIVRDALGDDFSIEQIDHIAVTNRPGLVGALLIGICFAKGLAYAYNKKLLTIDHLEGHIFSSALALDGSRRDVPFPHICLVASGGHTSLFFVKGYGDYLQIGQTLDDAAGEAFDKVAKLVGLGYPGGPQIEKLARDANFQDFFSYPRGKKLSQTLNFSFSGLKTAVLYDLVNRGAYVLREGIVDNIMTEELQKEVASSLLVCVADVIEAKIKLALKQYPQARGVTFVGGVACNSFLRDRLLSFCTKRGISFIVPPKKYCSDNAAMIAFVGGYKAESGQFSDLSVDVFEV